MLWSEAFFPKNLFAKFFNFVVFEKRKKLKNLSDFCNGKMLLFDSISKHQVLSSSLRTLVIRLDFEAPSSVFFSSNTRSNFH